MQTTGYTRILKENRRAEDVNNRSKQKSKEGGRFYTLRGCRNYCRVTEVSCVFHKPSIKRCRHRGEIKDCKQFFEKT